MSRKIENGKLKMDNSPFSILNSQLPKGYKQTEVGVIPEDWCDARIGDIASVQVGRDLREECFSTICDSRYRYPVFSNTVDQRGLYGFYSTPEYSGNSVTVVGRGVGLGTAFARTGGYGAIGRLIVLFPGDNLDSSFLTAYINQRVTIFHESGGIPQLTGIQIAKYRVVVPPLLEQRAIAGALSDVDALIGALDSALAKKRDLKQAAMQQLLTGQKRLPGFHGKWEVKKLGEMLDYEQPTKYLVKDSEYNDNNETPVLTAGKTFILGYTDEKTWIFNNLPVIIFDDFTTASKYVVFPFKAKSSAMKILKPKDENINLRFVFEKMQQIDFQLGDHKRHWISEFKLIEITIPTPVEQTAITEVLSDMDAEIAALEQRHDKTRALKQGMMQELLTGRIRLV